MDVFDYGNHFVIKLVQAHSPSRPLQIEIHPGLHCDLYRCPYCFGHGQQQFAGELLTVEDIARALDDLAGMDPLVQVAGVSTEPLTHPDAARMLAEIRHRNFRLGVHTKGYRLDGACADALTEGTSECFITLSVDASNNAEYIRIHNIASDRRDAPGRVRGDEYYDVVKANLRRLHALKVAKRAPLEIRVALLLFQENSDIRRLAAAADELAEHCDLVRMAVPQERNDGVRPENFPHDPDALLARLASEFRGHPKVRVLTGTANPARDESFNRCRAQRFQVVIDKCGNVFPCPQVALANYAWLRFGNIKTSTLAEILRSEERRRLFDRDVTTEMRCRVCDRRDEAINGLLGRLIEGGPSVRRTAPLTAQTGS